MVEQQRHQKTDDHQQGGEQFGEFRDLFPGFENMIAGAEIERGFPELRTALADEIMRKDEAREQGADRQHAQRNEHGKRRFMRIERVAVMSMGSIVMRLVIMGFVIMRGVIVAGLMPGGGPARRPEKRQKHQPPGIKGGEARGHRRQHIAIKSTGAL